VIHQPPAKKFDICPHFPYIHDDAAHSVPLKEDKLPTHIKTPTQIAASGNRPKIIEEFVGRVNTGTADLSIARMKSPGGWHEAGQRPEFDEYTVVLRGTLRVNSEQGSFEVRENEAIICRKGEWIQYSTPGDVGAEYIAICMPAFSPESVRRDTCG
jgi:mannose-6-phosphate isomerase-like protein (cupin superfamily)